MSETLSPALDLAWGATLLRTSLVLALVCAAAWLLIRFWARRQDLRRSRGGVLERVSSLSLGAGSSLHLVRARGRLLLLGVSQAGVVLLSELDPGQQDGAPESSAPLAAPPAKLEAEVDSPGPGGPTESSDG